MVRWPSMWSAVDSPRRWPVRPDGDGRAGAWTTLTPWSSAIFATFPVSGTSKSCRRWRRRAAAQTATLFNASDLAAPFEVTRPTIRDYMTLLERVFLVERLPAWHSNRLTRLVKRPKLHYTDTGLAAALLGLDGPALDYDRPRFGQLLETFVLQELRRHASWHGARMTFHHFRDRSGAEVDIVIDRGADGVAGIEVKASATVRSRDFRGLRRLQGALGPRFASGVVLYDGETAVPFGDRLSALPIRALL